MPILASIDERSTMNNQVIHFNPAGAEQAPFTTEVEILLGGVARLMFPDGTEQFVDGDDEPVHVYSPRLSPDALERFCEAHIERYQEFHSKHERQLIRCERVPMEKFWADETTAPKTYRIFHNYDQGDQSVYLSSLIDPTRAAVYCQFLAEDQLGESASVSNSGIAQALVEFYGCIPVDKTEDAIELDLYFARETLCGQGYEQLMADPYLQRSGIIDLIRPHTHTVGDPL
ncbi:hypothetical protein DENIT_20153 [Pseudomonas veronii]|nr:hypothetical protein DENIT_20153 [Pseudomonas veronii]